MPTGYTATMLRIAAAALALLCASCQATGAPPASASASAQVIAAAPQAASAAAPSTTSTPATTAVAATAAAVATAAPAGPGQVQARSFRSEALGVDKSYLVYLPAGADAGTKRYPVIYLLHGYAGDETNWVKVGGLPGAADALGLQAIVIMPDGDDSFYASWVTPLPHAECLKHRPSAFGRTEKAETHCVQRPRYEDYIVRDLVAHVEATYRAAADRRARAIIGLSMGGMGALMLAMRHTDVFAVAGSHSGVVSPLYEGPHPYREGQVVLAASAGLGKKFPQDLRDQALRVFGADVAVWRKHDPSVLAASLAPGKLAIYLDCGTEDGFQLADQASYLHEVLGKAKVAHTFELVPGDHSFSLWKQRIGKSLAFAAAEFRSAGY